MTFYSIFSKKKENENKITIIADHREKNSLVISELIKRNVEVEFQQLLIGDYIINNTAVERKTVSDFKSSIINKRIFSQIENLKQYPQHLLILEGILDEDIYSIGMHENAFRGFMLSLALQYNIPIIFTHNSEDTAKYLYVLAKKEPSGEASIRPSRILKTKEEQAQFILEGFPGIGPIKAKALLSKFKSLKNIINASEEELSEILGKSSQDFLGLVSEIVS